MKTTMDLVEKAREEIPHISCEDYKKIREGGEKHILLDVREAEEYEAGHIEGAILIPRGMLEFKIADAVPDKAEKIILCCAKGSRALLAGATLKELGYTHLFVLEGGYEGWCTSL